MHSLSKKSWTYSSDGACAVNPNIVIWRTIYLRRVISIYFKTCMIVFSHDIFWISGFPIWVSLLGIIFFEVIDRDEDGILEFDEISNYYKGLVGVKDEDLYVVSKEGYRALTAVRKIFFAHE